MNMHINSNSWLEMQQTVEQLLQVVNMRASCLDIATYDTLRLEYWLYAKQFVQNNFTEHLSTSRIMHIYHYIVVLTCSHLGKISAKKTKKKSQLTYISKYSN